MDHQPGDIIKGRYKIIRSLGRGGFGQTYLAEDRGSPDSPQCVVKQLKLRPDIPLSGQEAQNRFAKEATVLKKLGDDYDRIPGLLDYFEENQEFYFVQEFIDGQDLSNEITNGQQWSEGRVIALLYDVLEVLERIHRQDNPVIHRDIKPQNLIRRRSDRRIVVIDFGAVKEIMTTPEGQMQSTIVIGTPGYMPQEQENKRPCVSSDIYALGMVAIYALTGVSPNNLSHERQTNEVIWRNKARVSAELAAILDKMVRRDHRERYQSATEIIDDLEPLHRIGQTLNNRYIIISLWGEGALGQIYLAHDQQRPANPHCLIKQLKPQATGSFTGQNARSLFEKAAQFLHRLGNHDPFPKLWDDFEENQEFYLVQELIEGNALSQELHKDNRWSPEQVIEFLQNALKILELIHKENLIYRELPPSKFIRRKSDGKLFLSYLGLVEELMAREANVARYPSSRGTGTSGYMPKEQLEGKPKPNSNIYSLGAIAIQALTGVSPNELKTDRQTGEFIWRNRVPVSDALADIIDKMVRSYFRERYQSATEVLQDLQKLQHPEGSPEVQKPQHPNGYRQKGRQSVQRWISFAILVIAGPALFAGFKLFLRSQANELLNQGDIYFNAQKYTDAIAKYQEALKKSPNYTRPKAKLGIALANLNKGDSQKLDEAFKVCEGAIKDRNKVLPEYSEPWNCIGVVWVFEKKFQDAIEAYDKAIERDRTYHAPYYNRCDARLKWMKQDPTIKQYDLALADCEKAIALKPDYYFAWNNKGYALIGLERYQEAIKAFEEAKKRPGGYPEAEAGFGKAQEQLQKKLDAEKSNLDAEKSNSQNP